MFKNHLEKYRIMLRAFFPNKEIYERDDSIFVLLQQTLAIEVTIKRRAEKCKIYDRAFSSINWEQANQKQQFKSMIKNLLGKRFFLPTQEIDAALARERITTIQDSPFKTAEESFIGWLKLFNMRKNLCDEDGITVFFA